MMQWQIGKVKITRIVELVVSGDNEFVLPDAQNEKCLPLDWMQPHFMDEKGYLIFSVHALIVDTGEHKIMVDTCIGNDKQLAVPDWNNMQTAFLSDLETAGYPRDEIDTVLCTHLHVDHVGWNTMLVDGQWKPTFNNARYLVADTEWQYWDAHEDKIEIGPVMQQSVRPIVDAGLMDVIDCEHQVCVEVKLIPTPGHTPGHVSVRADRLFDFGWEHSEGVRSGSPGKVGGETSCRGQPPERNRRAGPPLARFQNRGTIEQQRRARKRNREVNERWVQVGERR